MKRQSNLPGKKVYIVDGSRTPFLKTKGQRGPFSASDLAVQTGRALLMRQVFASDAIQEVIIGNTIPGLDEANIARIIALRLGCRSDVPAWTVHRNCGSGMQALDAAAQSIATGRADLVLAGGGDAMSHAPLLFNTKMTNWLFAWMGAKSVQKRMNLLLQWRISFLTPVIALLQGLTDPIVGLNMGQTAEQLTYLFNISREAMDRFAVQSHERLAQAQDEHFLQEITPIIDERGRVYTTDDGLRRDCSLEKLDKLKPFFDPFGSVTAGNSSQITDGACLLLLASEKALSRYHLTPLGRIVDVEWAALSPSLMGLGPVHASTSLLLRHGFQLSDVDYWEINEAFAAQVLACQVAFADPNYCTQHFGISEPLGALNETRLNVDGGAIALGHPIAASGARLVLHLLHVLKRKQARLGVASLCIGGGQGGAMCVERI